MHSWFCGRAGGRKGSSEHHCLSTPLLDMGLKFFKKGYYSALSWLTFYSLFFWWLRLAWNLKLRATKQCVLFAIVSAILWTLLGRAPASPTVMLRISNLSLAMYIYIDRRVVTFLWASPVWRQTGQAQKNGAQSLRTRPKWYTTCTSSRFFSTDCFWWPLLDMGLKFFKKGYYSALSWLTFYSLFFWWFSGNL